jgi:hypothetical protein
MQKKVNTQQQAQVLPQIKNTFDWRPADPGATLTRYGVEYAIAKLNSQLLQCPSVPQYCSAQHTTNTYLATESDIALALTANGNISPVTTQAIGPQVLAKNAI